MNNQMPIDLAQSLNSYKNSLHGYQPIHIDLKKYTALEDVAQLPYYVNTLSFVPGKSRRTNQFNSIDYDPDMFTYDTESPILVAPLPKHNFSNSGALVRVDASITGLIGPDAPEENTLVSLYIDLFDLSGPFDPEDLSNAINEARYYAHTSVPAGTRPRITVTASAYFVAPSDETKQRIVAPRFRCFNTGMRIECASLHVEMYHDYIP